MRNKVVAVAVAGQRPVDEIVAGVCAGLDEKFGGGNVRVNGEVSEVSKSANRKISGMNCRVDNINSTFHSRYFPVR